MNATKFNLINPDQVAEYSEQVKQAMKGQLEFVYACFFADGEIIGFTKTAEDACDWSMRVASHNKGVRIIKIYQITNPLHEPTTHFKG